MLIFNSCLYSKNVEYNYFKIIKAITINYLQNCFASYFLKIKNCSSFQTLDKSASFKRIQTAQLEKRNSIRTKTFREKSSTNVNLKFSVFPLKALAKKLTRPLKKRKKLEKAK